MPRGTVVILDGDANARIVASTLLELRGFEVRGAADAAEASALLDRDGAKVVVFDSAVPGATTGELARHLRARGGCPHLIALTDEDACGCAEAASRWGADACLSRPVDPRRLIETVEGLAGTDLRPEATQE